MSDRSDVERRLEAWGDQPQPPVDGAFANRLDAQLRDMAFDRMGERPPRPFWQPALLAVLALVVVAAGVLVSTRPGDDQLALVMGPNSDTEIVLPNGEVVDAVEGLELADGTRISVGEGGSAVVGDVVLEPGSEALVVEGTLEVLTDVRTTGSTAVPTTRPGTTRPPTTRPTDSTVDDRPTTSDSDSSPERSTSTVTDSTADVPRSTAATSTTENDRTTTTSAAPEVVLTAESGRDRQIVLSWSYSGPDSLSGWEVTATSGDRTRTLVVLRDPAARSITLDAGDGPVGHRVIARDASGTVIAESNLVSTR